MVELKNPKIAIPIALLAVIFWSFGPYVVRNIDEAGSVPWQYLFTRGLVIFILLVVGLVRGRRRGMPTGWLILGILGFFIPPLQIATIIIVIYYNFIHKPNTHVFKPLKKMI